MKVPTSPRRGRSAAGDGGEAADSREQALFLSVGLLRDHREFLGAGLVRDVHFSKPPKTCPTSRWERGRAAFKASAR